MFRPSARGCTCAGGTTRDPITTTSPWPTSSTSSSTPGPPASRSRPRTHVTRTNGGCSSATSSEAERTSLVELFQHRDLSVDGGQHLEQIGRVPVAVTARERLERGAQVTGDSGQHADLIGSRSGVMHSALGNPETRFGSTAKLSTLPRQDAGEGSTRQTPEGSSRP